MTSAQKSNQAFRTISEAANELEVPQHVLRFWETKFSHIKPMKRGGGRRYYRPEDIHLLKGIRRLLYEDGFTIKGVQKVLRDRGVRFVMETGLAGPEHEPPIASNDDAPRAAAIGVEAVEPAQPGQPAESVATAQACQQERQAAPELVQELVQELGQESVPELPPELPPEAAPQPVQEAAPESAVVANDAGMPEARPNMAQSDMTPPATIQPPEQPITASAKAAAHVAEEAAQTWQGLPRPEAPITDEQRQRLEQVLSQLVELRQEVRNAMTELALPVPNTSGHRLNQRRG